MAEVLLYRLKVYFDAIIRDLEVGQVINYLYAKDILDRDDRDEILAEKTRKNEAQVLLWKIERRGGMAVQALIDALSRSSQKHLAHMLNTPVLNEEQLAVSKISQSLNKVTVSEPNVPEPDVLGRYSMERSPSGLAIIINNYVFEEKTLLEIREGATCDVSSLSKLFKKLQFETRYCNNLRLPKMKKVVRKYSVEEDHTNYDCFIMFFMSHGTEGGVYGTDGGVLDIHKDVAMSFTATNCPTLAGKPKLFFIQACRGKDYDKGIMRDGPLDSSQYGEITTPVQADGPNLGQSQANPEQNPDFPPILPLPISNQSSPTNTSSGGDLSQGQSSSNSDELVPNYADIYISFASSPSMASGRNTLGGSFFISKLVDVFMKNANKDNLDTMMKKVNAEVRKNTIPAGNGPDGKLRYHMQVPQIIGNMDKDLYFKPLPSLSF